MRKASPSILTTTDESELGGASAPPPPFMRAHRSKTLIISNSFDVTTDLLVEALGPEKIFRLNFDLWAECEIRITAASFLLRSAHDSLADDDTSRVVWRKPFNEGFEIAGTTDAYVLAEVRYLYTELFNLCALTGRHVFNWPRADARLGKLTQLRIARDIFNVPETSAFISHSEFIAGEGQVAKSLSSTQFDSGKVLYTTAIDGLGLAADYPWLIQDRIRASHDIMVVFVYGKLFAFSIDRCNYAGLDWCNHAHALSGGWLPYQLTTVQ